MQKDKTRLNSIRVTTAGISEGGGNSHRISYLDVAKGALIILLVFAHFRSALNRTDFKNDYFEYVYGWNSIFTCFYMPAFFLISGYCSNFRKDPKTFLKSLLKSLVLPLFALSLVNDTMYALMVTHQDISTTLLKTFLAFMKLSSRKDIIIFKYYPIPSSISPFVKSYLISKNPISLPSGLSHSKELSANHFYPNIPAPLKRLRKNKHILLKI